MASCPRRPRASLSLTVSHIPRAVERALEKLLVAHQRGQLPPQAACLSLRLLRRTCPLSHVVSARRLQRRLQVVASRALPVQLHPRRRQALLRRHQLRLQRRGAVGFGGGARRLAGRLLQAERAAQRTGKATSLHGFDE